MLKSSKKLIRHNLSELIDDDTFVKSIKPINSQIKSIEGKIELKKAELRQLNSTLENITDISKNKIEISFWTQIRQWNC